MLNNPTFRIDLYGLPRGAYYSIIHTYPALPICVLYSLQRQFKGFQNFTLLLNSESDIPAFLMAAFRKFLVLNICFRNH